MDHRCDARTSIVPQPVRHLGVHLVQSIISIHALGFLGRTLPGLASLRFGCISSPYCVCLVRIFQGDGGGGRRWTVALRKRPEQEWLHTGVFCK
jgi:hypothetical protein